MRAALASSRSCIRLSFDGFWLSSYGYGRVYSILTSLSIPPVSTSFPSAILVQDWVSLVIGPFPVDRAQYFNFDDPLLAQSETNGSHSSSCLFTGRVVLAAVYHCRLCLNFTDSGRTLGLTLDSIWLNWFGLYTICLWGQGKLATTLRPGSSITLYPLPVSSSSFTLSLGYCCSPFPNHLMINPWLLLDAQSFDVLWLLILTGKICW